ncbi:MAG: hypothetical protein AAB472_02360 [Patescibacteria group bacterium]
MSLVRLIILVTVLVLALSFFGISIRGIVSSPTGHDNLTFVWELIHTGWGIIVSQYHHLVDVIQSVLPEQN